MSAIRKVFFCSNANQCLRLVIKLVIADDFVFGNHMKYEDVLNVIPFFNLFCVESTEKNYISMFFEE